ncbi:MAG: gluconate 2-dehydrogenase subunit 3 family protein [Acidobacteriaceae bacterium]|nr:gluconate 2-dehydrogenase subunit 3 family protein [Acidobacteriaceae bacterium]
MKPSRRVFLGAGAAAPVLVSAIQPAVQESAKDVQDRLKTVMDLMIPESDGMPSASQAGGLIYLERLMQRDENDATEIRNCLAVVDAFSERSFTRPFTQLEKENQVDVLKQVEDQALRVFALLRGYVYESYYTQPAVWKLIGYELYPTDRMGPHLPPIDEALFADVRKMPKLYKDV